MKLETIRKKARANLLEVEDILAAGRKRVPGLQKELMRLSQAGRQANEPSGWCTTKYWMPPRSRHLLMSTASPKRGWNR